MIDVRKGQAPPVLTREEFGRRFRAPYFDPLFTIEAEAIARLEEIAWRTYQEGRKSPITRKAGAGFADPDFELSVEWLATRQRLEEAQASWSNPTSPSRVLLICGSARNDGTCPGEMSKTYRLLNIIRDTFNDTGVLTDTLDLSLLTSDYGRHTSTPARAVSPPPCRCATGPARAIPIMVRTRPTTGWPKSTNAGRKPTP